MIFGMNLLSIASTAIASQTVTWKRFKERVQNSRGMWISSYDDPVEILGSWQPVPESTIRDLGLDTTRRYHNFYTSNSVENVARGTSPDLMEQGGFVHEVVERTDWYEQNGWRGILCVELGPVEIIDEPEDP